MTTSIIPSTQTKKCLGCGETKKFDEFGKPGEKRNGFCKSCIIEHGKFLASFDTRFSRRRLECPEGKSYCARCDIDKDISEFGKNSSRPNGLMTHCKECQKKDTVKNRVSLVSTNRKRNYGISLEQYQALKESQGDVCAICGKLETKIHKGIAVDLSVDHDHETGKVRGLLCSACNASLGGFRDSIENLSNAIDYLMGLNR